MNGWQREATHGKWRKLHIIGIVMAAVHLHHCCLGVWKFQAFDFGCSECTCFCGRCKM